MTALALSPGFATPVFGQTRKVQKKKLPVSWRLDPELVDYVMKRAQNEQGEKQRGGQVAIVEEALRQHRDLEQLLGGEVDRLKRFALDQGLDLRDDAARVISAAVKAGLDAKKLKR